MEDPIQRKSPIQRGFQVSRDNGLESREGHYDPFAKIESRLKEATPKLISHLAKMEANKKPWSQSEFPVELVRERIEAFADKRKVKLADSEIERISKDYSKNLWVLSRKSQGSGQTRASR